MKKQKTIHSLQYDAKKLVDKLQWHAYHAPENLVLFLFSEVAELGEYCTWTTKADLMREPIYSAVKEEIADILKNVIYLLNSLNYSIPIETLVHKKFQLDSEEYPIEQFSGKHRYQVYKGERKLHREKQYHRALACIRPLSSDIIPIDDLQETAWTFAMKRNWTKFYTPASLVLAIAVKAGEIAVMYQKRPILKRGAQEKSIWAITSLIITLLRLCEYLEINNVYEIVMQKFDKDGKRFMK